jgi:HSP20 family protein
MKVVHYEPWGLINKMHRDLDRLFASAPAVEPGHDEPVADWLPAVDIAEEDGRFLVRADIPGVEPDMIEITMEDGVLSLRGERGTAVAENNAQYRRAERASGKFYRRFHLPDVADAEGITAHHKNGVLEIVIPKQAKVMPRKIAVEVS